MPRKISLNSRRKLKPGDAERFTNAEPALFVELAQVVCATGMLPQKELHECWQMAKVVHRAFPESLHVADIAAGHGLLAWILVLLARSSETPIPRTAVAVDIKRPKSANILGAAIAHHWPDLAGSVHYVEGSIDAVVAEDGPCTLLVAAHACGSLSDRVLMAAIRSRSPLAIMPCCHSLRKQTQTLTSLTLASGLPSDSISTIESSAAIVGQAPAIDQFRIDVLAALGYEISEGSIQAEITAFHRIIMAKPLQYDPSTPTHDIPEARRTIKREGEIRAFETIPTLNVASLQDAQVLAQRPSREWLRSFDLSFWVDDEATGPMLASSLEYLTRVALLRPLAQSPSIPDALQDARLVFAYLAAGKPISAGPEISNFTSKLSIRDRYMDPLSQRLAFTYRIEIGSSTVELSKADAVFLRNRLCKALAGLSPMLSNHFELR